jgi:hypothetical protein
MNATLPTAPAVPERVGTRTLLKLYETPDGWFVKWRCDCKMMGVATAKQWPRSRTCGRCSKPHKWRLPQGHELHQKLSAKDRAQGMWCERLRCALTRGACAARFETFNAKRHRIDLGGAGCACTGCTVGALHKSGVPATHWLDGSGVRLVQLLAKPSDKPIKRRRCMSCGGRVPQGRFTTCSTACNNDKQAHDKIAQEIASRMGHG